MPIFKKNTPTVHISELIITPEQMQKLKLQTDLEQAAGGHFNAHINKLADLKLTAQRNELGNSYFFKITPESYKKLADTLSEITEISPLLRFENSFLKTQYYEGSLGEDSTYEFKKSKQLTVTFNNGQEFNLNKEEAGTLAKNGLTFPNNLMQLHKSNLIKSIQNLTNPSFFSTLLGSSQDIESITIEKIDVSSGRGHTLPKTTSSLRLFMFADDAHLPNLCFDHLEFVNGFSGETHNAYNYSLEQLKNYCVANASQPSKVNSSHVDRILSTSKEPIAVCLMSVRIR